MSSAPSAGLARPPFLACALALTLASCASTSDDIALSPLCAHTSVAGGGEELEFLGGAIKLKRPPPGADLSEWEVHPVVCHERNDQRSLTRYLVPLGRREVETDRSLTELLPLFRLQVEPDGHGGTRTYWISLPMVLWAEDSTERTFRGAFPFGGVWERFATYDRITFALFPLYMKTEREGGTFHHFLWPLFSCGRNGRNELDFHVWPLYGIARPGMSESRYLLWPFYTQSRERLHLDPEHHVHSWMLWPFYGRKSSATFLAHAILWPFFGWSRDTRSGYWSWDGPWPLVRITRPGTSSEAYRTRVWPFYSHFDGDGLSSTWVLWPFVNWREETYQESRRVGQNVIPFWQSFVESDLDGGTRAEWAKLWPLFQYHRRDDQERLGIPTLLPTWHMPLIDEHYAWLWELYTRESAAGAVHERSWLGLWRRESDAVEQREYVSGLWSRRKYRDPRGTVREHSLLLGLLRWRTSDGDGFEFMAPAFPGPGWPERAARRH
jgi:hypothetical protein